MPIERIALFSAQVDGRFLSIHDQVSRGIGNGTEIEALMSVLGTPLDTTDRIGSILPLPRTSPPDEFHIIAFPLGNTQYARVLTDRITWMRRLQIVLGVVLVPTSIVAAVTQSVDYAAAIGGISTALIGGATTAISVWERRRRRAFAEIRATPIAELVDAHLSQA